MRNVSGTIHWEEDRLHPFHKQMMASDTISPIATQYVELLDDGTCLSLERFEGDTTSVAQLLGDTDSVLSFDIAGGDNLLAYVHKEPTATHVSLQDLLRTHEVAFNWPITYGCPTEMRVRLIGEQSAVADLVDGLPDGLSFSLTRTESWQSASSTPMPRLTDRQREILRAAVRMGYYEVPRQTTQRALGDELGLARGTVAEHLQKIEAATLPTLV